MEYSFPVLDVEVGLTPTCVPNGRGEGWPRRIEPVPLTFYTPRGRVCYWGVTFGTTPTGTQKGNRHHLPSINHRPEFTWVYAGIYGNIAKRDAGFRVLVNLIAHLVTPSKPLDESHLEIGWYIGA